MNQVKTGKPENVVFMKGIVKRFPGVLANDQVNFDLRRGEVHALLGENGAGKSTLMNVLAGLYRADGGTMTVHGHPVDFAGLPPVQSLDGKYSAHSKLLAASAPDMGEYPTLNGRQ